MWMGKEDSAEGLEREGVKGRLEGRLKEELEI